MVAPGYAYTQKFSNEEITIASVTDLIAQYLFLLLVVSHSCLESKVRKRYPSTSVLKTSSPTEVMGLDSFLWLSPAGLCTKGQKQERDPEGCPGGVHEGALANCPSYQEKSIPSGQHQGS